MIRMQIGRDSRMRRARQLPGKWPAAGQRARLIGFRPPLRPRQPAAATNERHSLAQKQLISPTDKLGAASSAANWQFDAPAPEVAHAGAGAGVKLTICCLAQNAVTMRRRH